MNVDVHSYIRGLAPQLAPELLPSADGSSAERFADLLVALPAGNVVVDWCVFSPLCASAPSAKKSEQRKIRSYKAPGVTATVIPAVIATTGGFSAPTLRFCRTIENACNAEKNSLVKLLALSVARATSSMIHSARYRAGLAQRRARAAADPPTAPQQCMSLADLDVLDDDDCRLDFEVGVLHASALSRGTTTQTEQAPEEEDEEEEEEEEEENDDETENDEEKAVEVEDNEAPTVVSLPADSPLLFVPVASQNSLLATDAEGDVDREMEIMDEAVTNDEGKNVCGKTNGKDSVNLSLKKQTTKEGSGQGENGPKPTPNGC
jgi:hypothetical protein